MGTTVKRVLLIVAGILIVVAFNTALVASVVQSRERRHADCLQKRGIYDGQILFAKFIGHELNATELRIEQGLTRLRVVLGPRPEC